ncbi:hypothetical protein Q4511_10375 [Paracoccus sp. 1_MG-2023]|uniref:COG3650 family protein n=1 Tax=unclassified Paracoccus (in: a-proteobacteria) TaxID=2688777 RepID=UPI001C08DDA2|nr:MULTISPECIES: hypothetical protein [unclassified Paracoccus (in: a-proteobacteria)]MBU2958084.1 hypothetical protein [Paracoccus sp. C2R09]MDO6669330.1 hypothetical protein [Paracoccus sp. 1_MG-2023]
MTLRPAPARLALLALITLPLAGCDSAAMTDLRRNIGLEEAAPEPQDPAQPRPPAVSPLEQPIETGAEAPRAIPGAEPLTYNATAFVARGNEPFWNVEISGGSATYRTPDNQNGRSVSVDRIVFADGVEYVGVLDGRPFVVNLRAQECQDTMADEKFPLTASLTVRGQKLSGCGQTATVNTAAPTEG